MSGNTIINRNISTFKNSEYLTRIQINTKRQNGNGDTGPIITNLLQYFCGEPNAQI